MEGKKKYIALIIFLFLGLMIFTFASSPEEKLEDVGTGKKKGDSTEEVSEKKEDTEKETLEAVEETTNETDNIINRAGFYQNPAISGTGAASFVPLDKDNSTKAKQLVEQLENMVQQATSEEEIGSARDFRKKETIQDVVEQLENGSVKDDLLKRLEALGKILDDKNAPTITGVDNNTFTKENVTLTVEDDTKTTTTVTKDGQVIEQDNLTFEEEGKYEITVEDEAFHKTTVTFTIDKTAPTIVLDKLVNGYTNQKDLTIKDQNQFTSKIEKDGDTIDENISSDLQDDGTYYDRYGVYSGEGSYTITATDQAKNTSSVTFIYDKTPANLTGSAMYTDQKAIVKNKKSYYYARVGSKITFYMTVEEQLAHLPTITLMDEKGHELVFDETNEEISESENNKKYTYSLNYTVPDDTPLEEGIITAKVSNVEDKSGNVGILWPQSKKHLETFGVTNSSMVVVLNKEAPKITRVKVQSQMKSTNIVNLKDILMITVEVNEDILKEPTITINGIKPKYKTPVTKQTFPENSENPTNVKYTFYEVQLSEEMKLEQDAPISVTVSEVKDLAGNPAEEVTTTGFNNGKKEKEVLYDNDPSKIYINGEEASEEKVYNQLEVTTDSDATFTVVDSEGNEVEDLSTVTDGEYTITATDQAGSVTSITVEVDKTIPELKWDNGKVVGNGNIVNTIDSMNKNYATSLVATDKNIASIILYNYQTKETKTIDATEDGIIKFELSSLIEGENKEIADNLKFSIKAVDKAGNIKERALEVGIEFYIDNKAPEITAKGNVFADNVVIENGKTYRGPVFINVLDSSLKMVQIYKDGKEEPYKTEEFKKNNYDPKVTLKSNPELNESGSYKVVATDRANNITTLEFTIDNDPVQINSFDVAIIPSTGATIPGNTKYAKETDSLQIILRSNEELDSVDGMKLMITTESWKGTKEIPFVKTYHQESKQYIYSATTYIYEGIVDNDDFFHFEIVGLNDQVGNGIQLGNEIYEKLTDQEATNQVQFDVKPITLDITSNRKLVRKNQDGNYYYHNDTVTVGIAEDDVYSVKLNGNDFDYKNKKISSYSESSDVSTGTLEVLDKAGNKTETKIIALGASELYGKTPADKRAVKLTKSNTTKAIKNYEEGPVTLTFKEYYPDSTEEIIFTRNAEPIEFTIGEDVTVEEEGTYHFKATDKAGWVVDYTFIIGNQEAFEKVVGVKNVDELKQIASTDHQGKTIILTSDINLKGAEWTPIAASTNLKDAVIDGNGHTISNMTVNHHNCGSSYECNGFVGEVNTPLTIENLNFSNVQLNTSDKEHSYVGAVVGHANADLTINNVTVDGISISDSNQAAALVGASNNDVTINNCVVKNAKLGAVRGVPYAGTTGIFYGSGNGNVIINNSRAENVQLYTDNDDYIYAGSIANKQLIIDGEVVVPNKLTDVQRSHLVNVVAYSSANGNEIFTTVPVVQADPVEDDPVSESSPSTPQESNQPSLDQTLLEARSFPTTSDGVVLNDFPYLAQTYSRMESKEIFEEPEITVTSSKDEEYNAFLKSGNYQPKNVIWWAQFSCNMNQCEGFNNRETNKKSGTIVEGRRGDVSIKMEAPKAKDGYKFVRWETYTADYANMKIQGFEAIYEKEESVLSGFSETVMNVLNILFKI